MSAKFRDIFVSANRDLASFGMVFIYPPENFDQKQLGTIFGIIKILDTSQESSFIANLLASVIKKEYFSKPGRAPYESFEASLRKANLALAELARQGSVKWIGKINFTGGVIEKNHLHFSKLGNASILLLRNGMIADISAGMGEEPIELDPHPLKTFSVISSGKVELGDCLVFTTSDLLEIFSLEEIRQNAASFSRDEFPDILSASLASNSELSGCIVANITAEEESEDAVEIPDVRKIFSPPPPPPKTPVLSPEKFVRTKYVPKPARPSTVPLPAAKTSRERENNLYISESDEIIPRQSLWKRFSIVVRNMGGDLWNAVSNVSKKFGLQFRRINWRNLFRSIGSALHAPYRFFRKIDWQKNRLRFLIAGGAIAILVASYFSWHFIIGKKEAANPAPPDTSSQNTSSDVALNDINVKNIDSLSDVAKLPPDGRELLSMNNALFALAGDKSIVSLDPSNGEAQNYDSGITSGKFQLAAAMPDLNTIFVLTADKKLISFTPANNKFQENNISLPGNLNAVDIKAYLTYIYFLDSSANQIYRYPRAEGGFGSQQDWLKSGVDIKNSSSFSINEDLFVASRNQITAYSQGKKDDKINFENPNTPLVIDKIFTAPDLENIYVLDNKNHRVVQYSKDGKIVNQYFNASVAGTKDFSVDEKSKAIYLQKTESVLKFSIE